MRIEKNEFATILIPEKKDEIQVLEKLWDTISDDDKSYNIEERDTFYKKSEDDIAILIDHGI